MTTITITRRTTTPALFRALCALCALLVCRLAQSTITAAKAARTWLNTPHTYFKEDGPEAVTVTGWQYIGIQCAAAVVVLLLSIEW